METTPEQFNSAIATVIRAERAVQMMALRDLSEKTGIPTTTLMRLEKGERDIRISDLQAIANALGTTVEEVIARAK